MVPWDEGAQLMVLCGGVCLIPVASNAAWLRIVSWARGWPLLQTSATRGTSRGEQPPWKLMGGWVKSSAGKQISKRNHPPSHPTCPNIGTSPRPEWVSEAHQLAESVAPKRTPQNQPKQRARNVLSQPCPHSDRVSQTIIHAQLLLFWFAKLIFLKFPSLNADAGVMFLN